jgi:hypothetical protein
MRKPSFVQNKIKKAHKRWRENQHIQSVSWWSEFFLMLHHLNAKQLLMFLQNIGNYTNTTVRTSYLVQRFLIAYSKYKDHVIFIIKPTSPYSIQSQIVRLPNNNSGFIWDQHLQMFPTSWVTLTWMLVHYVFSAGRHAISHQHDGTLPPMC